MDELEISGKRYLSAKRAAREHRYHSDYIGQLIRSNKVAGQKVGRSWYVDAESLNAYLQGETQAPTEVTPAVAAPEPVQEIQEVAAEPATPVVVESVQETVPEPIPQEEVAPKKEIEHEIKLHIHTDTSPVTKEEPPKERLRFIADDEPFLPTVPPTTKTYARDLESASVVPATESVVQRNAPRSRRGGLALSLAGLVAFALASAGSYFFISHTEVVGERTSASVFFSVPE